MIALFGECDCDEVHLTYSGVARVPPGANVCVAPPANQISSAINSRPIFRISDMGCEPTLLGPLLFRGGFKGGRGWTKLNVLPSLSHPLGHLGVTYALHLWLIAKPVVDFIFVVIELFSLSPTVETLWAEIGPSRRFSNGVGHFERRFQREGGVAHQPLLVSE